MPEPAVGADATQPPGSGALVSQLMLGYMSTQLVAALLRLELPDRIGDQERESRELAAEAAMDPSALYRLLRTAASLGLLRETSPERFGLTRAGQRLRRDVPNSLHAMATVFTDPSMYRAWEDLERSVGTGQAAFPERFGQDYYSHLAQDPELSQLFNVAHGQTTRGVGQRLGQVYDLTAARWIVDVGGGDGTLLAAVLAETPQARGTVYDTAAGLAQAQATFAQASVADRADTHVGDFRKSVPAGADVYLVKSTLHNWDDEQCADILRSCRAAVPDAGVLLLLETVLPEMVEPGAAPFAYLSDLNMLVNLGGRERTEAEFRALLAAAGFAMASVRSLDGTGDLGLRLIAAIPT